MGKTISFDKFFPIVKFSNSVNLKYQAMDYFPSNKDLKDNNWVPSLTFRLQNESYSVTKKNATAVPIYPAEKLKWEKLKISLYKKYENSYVQKISWFGGSVTEYLLK